jgi:hypothetical protein
LQLIVFVECFILPENSFYFSVVMEKLLKAI